MALIIAILLLILIVTSLLKAKVKKVKGVVN